MKIIKEKKYYILSNLMDSYYYQSLNEDYPSYPNTTSDPQDAYHFKNYSEAREFAVKNGFIETKFPVEIYEMVAYAD